jgi:hypothetical protein
MRRAAGASQRSSRVGQERQRREPQDGGGSDEGTPTGGPGREGEAHGQQVAVWTLPPGDAAFS